MFSNLQIAENFIESTLTWLSMTTLFNNKNVSIQTFKSLHVFKRLSKLEAGFCLSFENITVLRISKAFLYQITRSFIMEINLLGK